MKAVVIDEYGGSDRLQVREIDKPRPGTGAVLIRVRAAGVNPIDWKIRRGTLRGVLWLWPPIVLGGDVAGAVEEVGPGVSRFRLGDPVLAMLSPGLHGPGGYAEYVLAPESAVARKPESLDFTEAASIPIAALTALQALSDLGRLTAGQTVLINGASGGVGTFAIQIAKALGARVTGVCGPANVARVRALGADTIIDYTREDFTRRPETYEIILDAIAKSSFTACARILRPGGTYITTLPSPEVLVRGFLQPITSLFGSDKRAQFVLAKPRGSDLEYLGRLADEGRFKPVIDRVFPLEQAKEAHDYSETEHARGKIVLSVGG